MTAQPAVIACGIDLFCDLQIKGGRRCRGAMMAGASSHIPQGKYEPDATKLAASLRNDLTTIQSPIMDRVLEAADRRESRADSIGLLSRRLWHEHKGSGWIVHDPLQGPHGSPERISGLLVVGEYAVL